MDTRFDMMPENNRKNVFRNILQPMKHSYKNESVQAEIHSRKRQDHFEFTVLLNDMRLVAIFDWWETAQNFIFQDVDNVPTSSPEHQRNLNNNNKRKDNVSFELKLNITDSEIVVVEKTSQWDSIAVILKSTTVITYKPSSLEKPLSCNLNNCEMFSCILGKEEETALSIIDPVTLNIDINKDNILEAQLQFLTVRLSYHDMCMFLRILKSLPKQMLTDRNEEKSQFNRNSIAKLTSMGFKTEDCIKALEFCEQKPDEAALWLTQNANLEKRPYDVQAIEVKASGIFLCIIDDCGDSDVPLLELSLSQVGLQQILPQIHEGKEIFPQGYLECCLASDYYNRVLSGWEPFIEPWRCKVDWERSRIQEQQHGRLNVRVESADRLNVNITSTLIDLYQKVKENWTKDYSVNQNRNRSLFIPFALKNDTGRPLHFTTFISELNNYKTHNYSKNEKWHLVPPNETVSFSFLNRLKMRHRDSHKMKMHQLAVKVDGWEPVSPVTVDRVGIFFRTAPLIVQENNQLESPSSARIVFDISLEGSARKLITVRSAVLVINKLPESIDLKLDQADANPRVRLMSVEPGKCLSIPLEYAYAQIFVKPNGYSCTYSNGLSWNQMPNYLDTVFEMRNCHNRKGDYRFCAKIVRDCQSQLGQPAHKIILLPTVKLCNLLPIDLEYNISGYTGRISAGAYVNLTSVNPEEAVELEVNIENFKSISKVIVPIGCNMEFKCRINLEDVKGRKLILKAEICPNSGAKLRLSVSASYWIVNKTGLPLIFRQTGTGSESAGQFAEHEMARMVSPLLFSFSDQEASTTINARVGNKLVTDGFPQWSSNFHAKNGIQVIRLYVTMQDRRPDTVFIVGVETRTGRGKYRSTTIVTISPRYQVYNQSSYVLKFAQSCFAQNVGDARSSNNFLKAYPNSHMPFHWPRLDKDQLLCVSIDNIKDCCWSGGLLIDVISSLHVNVRDINGTVYFLRLEVLLQGATFFIIFTDADTLPPPIRIDNFSEVAITFSQTYCKDTVHSTARAHASVPYAWDEPLQKHCLTVVAPGDVSETYDLNKLGPQRELTYENFIYIAFTGTFKSGKDVMDPLDVEGQELVLDVVKGNHVVLSRKRQGQRSQLWRMTPEGRLQHEGSSPPSHPHQPRDTHNILVLDIEGTAPQPSTYSRLMLRRVDPRRRSTQTWRFTEEGRLCCAHFNMCVQAQDGFFGLKQGNAAVLGLPQPVCHKMTEKGIPIEQAISRQRLRPGSGILSVNIEMDGPTRVLSIKDKNESRIYATPDEREWNNISVTQRPNFNFHDLEDKKTKGELQIVVNLQGLGISMVSCKTPEELLYCLFSNIVGQTVLTPTSKQLDVSVEDIQIDNQLLDTPVPVVLYVTPPNSRNSDEIYHKLPAIGFKAEIQEKFNENAVIFKHFILSLKKITVILEERLLLKFFDFIGFHSKDEELVSKDETDQIQRLLIEVSAAQAKRYYFGVLKLIPEEIRLSVYTASKLPPHLKKIKKKLGLTLIKFEDAGIDLSPFERQHPFETSQVLINSIFKHFRDELIWRAGKILASVDFLGNPLGLYYDVSEGFFGLINDPSLPNVVTLVKNVTHGVSNSTVKVTETISDGLGRAVLDDYHEEIRQKIRQVESGRGIDHVMAGIKGLGFGVLGGATGIFKQAYEGANNDGINGLVTGLGKGLVGVVTKPVVGLLDFASETARALRDSSKSKLVPQRVRLPRCVHGPTGLLPRYSSKQSQGQQYLYVVNNRDYKEKLVAYEIIGSVSEEMHCIVSDVKVRIVTSTQTSDLTTVVECHLSDLETCNVTTETEGSEHRYYIEIVMHITGTSGAYLNPDPVKRPRVRCRSAELAKSVSQKINYAKRLYLERLYTLSNDNIINLED